MFHKLDTSLNTHEMPKLHASNAYTISCCEDMKDCSINMSFQRFHVGGHFKPPEENQNQIQ